MIIQAVEESEARFEAYVQALASVIGHQDRTGPLKGYCKGLLVDTDRKSVEPMAAATAPERAAPQHQSLKGSVIRIVSSRSGDVLSSATGQPTSSSTRRTYLMQVAGSSP